MGNGQDMSLQAARCGSGLGFGYSGTSFGGLVFPPVAGIALPMIEVFHAPVLADHFAEQGGCFAAVLMGGA